MAEISLAFLTQQLELADELLAGRDQMLTPQDLPGRYGRAVKRIDRLLEVLACPALLAGGWAVWRHGFVGRVTQDLEIVLPADRIPEFLRLAAVSGFQILPQPEGRWPKLCHKDTDINVDILPEGARPGISSKPAPTTIPHPSKMGAAGATLRYIGLPSLVELKLAAGRVADEHDVVELVRTNPNDIETIRQHLTTVHSDYVAAFDHLAERARQQEDR
jgi:hypothetical protein